MGLNIMVLESGRGAADEAASELRAAGHTVLRCHETGAPDFPCRGIADARTCPLRSTPVDVAITVRSGTSSRPSPGEDGVRCALMSHVPLVVAGSLAQQPWVGFETRVLGRGYDVVAICEAAAAAELPEHARRALAVISTTIGVGPSVPTVSVVRRNGGLLVRVAGLDGLTRQARQAAVVRVVGALHELDGSARSIDVVIDSVVIDAVVV
jgi:hypothetical protein